MASLKTKIDVDIELLKKYDQPGPRYTSYPTAPYFHEGVGAADFLEHIHRDDQEKSDEGLSFYFHIPFCDTLCYFCGCNMMVTRNREKIAHYLGYLIKEMELMRPHINPKRKIKQLHWGGGTPTHLKPDEIRRLGFAIRDMFGFADDAELSVEIDPRELTKEHMQALRDVGFNRCSMGVQDFNPKIQKAVNRIQPESITRQTVDWARELGFHSVNIDLMYGLPFQTVESFNETLDKVLDIDPDRLAVFNYAHLPQIFKHQRLIKAEWLPRPEQKLEILKLTIEKLTESRYVYIGMDHFAKPDDELTIAMNEGTLYRNFQGYSTHAGLNVLAFGITSISMLSDMYVQNVKKLNDYYERIDRGELPVFRGVVLNKDDILRREVITELMCNFRLKKERIEQKYGIEFDSYFASALQKLIPFQDDGLIELHPDMLKVTTAGRLLIRNIAMQFDAYLERKTDKKPQFSRTV